MPTRDELEKLQAGFQELKEKAEDHFERWMGQLEAIAAATKEDWSPEAINSNWERFRPGEAIGEAYAVERLVPPLALRLSSYAKQSPLLSDADVRDISRATKEMMAALRFRQHRQWDQSVLHDEGTVLGVQPAGQDEQPLSLSGSRRAFDSALSELVRILSFLAAEESNLPAAMEAARQKAVVGIRPGTAFIMMWLDKTKPELQDVKEAIKAEFLRFDIKAVPADEIEHSDVITERILNEIATAEFLIADLTGERPSVYYEVGYAHALSRRPILYRREGTPLHFDLSVHNCPAYENVTALRILIGKRLQAMLNREPKG
jgi:hypothetical protein